MRSSMRHSSSYKKIFNLDIIEIDNPEILQRKLRMCNGMSDKLLLLDKMIELKNSRKDEIERLKIERFRPILQKFVNRLRIAVESSKKAVQDEIEREQDEKIKKDLRYQRRKSNAFEESVKSTALSNSMTKSRSSMLVPTGTSSVLNLTNKLHITRQLAGFIDNQKEYKPNLSISNRNIKTERISTCILAEKLGPISEDIEKKIPLSKSRRKIEKPIPKRITEEQMPFHTTPHPEVFKLKRKPVKRNGTILACSKDAKKYQKKNISSQANLPVIDTPDELFKRRNSLLKLLDIWKESIADKKRTRFIKLNSPSLKKKKIFYQNLRHEKETERRKKEFLAKTAREVPRLKTNKGGGSFRIINPLKPSISAKFLHSRRQKSSDFPPAISKVSRELLPVSVLPSPHGISRYLVRGSQLAPQLAVQHHSSSSSSASVVASPSGAILSVLARIRAKNTAFVEKSRDMLQKMDIKATLGRTRNRNRKRSRSVVERDGSFR